MDKEGERGGTDTATLYPWAVTLWSFPSTMVTRKIAPALAVGCSVVLKSASATPLTAEAEIVHKAGLPAGVFNVVVGKRSSPPAKARIGPDFKVPVIRPRRSRSRQGSDAWLRSSSRRREPQQPMRHLKTAISMHLEAAKTPKILLTGNFASC